MPQNHSNSDAIIRQMDLSNVFIFAGTLLLLVMLGRTGLQRSARLNGYAFILSLLAAVGVAVSLSHAIQRTVLSTPVSPVLEGGVQQTCEKFAQTAPCTTAQVRFRGYPFAMTEQLLVGPREPYPYGTRPTLIGARRWGQYVAGDYAFCLIVVCLFAYPLTYLREKKT